MSPEPGSTCCLQLFAPPASSNKLNYRGETDPFFLQLRLKDSSSQGCLLALIRTSGLSVPTPPPHPTKPAQCLTNSAPSYPDGDKEQRLKGSPWADMTPRASAQRKAHRWGNLAGFEKSFRVYKACPDVSWQAIRAISEWHKTQIYLTCHGWSWKLNAAF